MLLDSVLDDIHHCQPLNITLLFTMKFYRKFEQTCLIRLFISTKVFNECFCPWTIPLLRIDFESKKCLKVIDNELLEKISAKSITHKFFQLKSEKILYDFGLCCLNDHSNECKLQCHRQRTWNFKQNWLFKCIGFQSETWKNVFNLLPCSWWCTTLKE